MATHNSISMKQFISVMTNIAFGLRWRERESCLRSRRMWIWKIILIQNIPLYDYIIYHDSIIWMLIMEIFRSFCQGEKEQEQLNTSILLQTISYCLVKADDLCYACLPGQYQPKLMNGLSFKLEVWIIRLRVFEHWDPILKSKYRQDYNKIYI